MALKALYATTNEDWLQAWAAIPETTTRDDAARLIAKTSADMVALIRHKGWKRPAFAWSGGKDSQVLALLCQCAAIDRCVLCLAPKLEFDASLHFYAMHGPYGLSTAEFDFGPEWVAAKPERRLFAGNMGDYGPLMTWAGQKRYGEQRHIDVMVMGRRTQDGNQAPLVSTARQLPYVTYNPMRAWKHEDVLMVLYWYEIPLFPSQRDGWPNGWVNSSGTWSGRGSWADVHAIDPSIIRDRQLWQWFPQAKEMLDDRTDLR